MIEFSPSKKIGIITGVLLLTAVCLSSITVYFSFLRATLISQEARAIDLTGSQRMLTERLDKLVTSFVMSKLDGDAGKSTASSIEEIDRVFNDLEKLHIERDRHIAGKAKGFSSEHEFYKIVRAMDVANNRFATLTDAFNNLKQRQDERVLKANLSTLTSEAKSYINAIDILAAEKAEFLSHEADQSFETLTMLSFGNLVVYVFVWIAIVRLTSLVVKDYEDGQDPVFKDCSPAVRGKSFIFLLNFLLSFNSFINSIIVREELSSIDSQKSSAKESRRDYSSLLYASGLLTDMFKDLKAIEFDRRPPTTKIEQLRMQDFLSDFREVLPIWLDGRQLNIDIEESVPEVIFIDRSKFTILLLWLVDRVLDGRSDTKGAILFLYSYEDEEALLLCASMCNSTSAIDASSEMPVNDLPDAKDLDENYSFQRNQSLLVQHYLSEMNCKLFVSGSSVKNVTIIMQLEGMEER